MMMATNQPKKSSSSTDALQVFSISPKIRFSYGTLRTLLPDVETAFFFAKAYKLDASQVMQLLGIVFDNSDIVAALLDGDHSVDLQDYLLDLYQQLDADRFSTMPEDKGCTFSTEVQPQGEILPELWESLQLTIADSIQQVADQLGDVLDKIPAKHGEMVFRHMLTVNKLRPKTLGVYAAQIQRVRQAPNLVILDVSGSMSEHTIRTIVEDVVALSTKADASLAIVSNNTFVWDPGTYTVEAVLREAEYMGTHYETLVPLFKDHDWGTVVTIADYDSSASAKDYFASHAQVQVGEVIDVSLVHRPTFLAECVGTIAQKVTPALLASRNLRY